MEQNIDTNQYMVCIHCMTYNHENYIEDALKGFVMQKTNFPFVAVVIDDCSTDRTAEIIKKYERLYPEIIKAVYLPENYYSQKKSKRAFLEPWDSKSKYIAECEGDDYWIEPYKLQKQVDFLESHPDYSMCFHGANIIVNVQKHIDIRVNQVEDREYFSKDIFPDWLIPTASVVYRNDLIRTFPPLKHREWAIFGDIVLFMKCCHLGRIWGISDKMSVYRRHDGGVSNNKWSQEFEDRYCKHLRFLSMNFPKINKTWIHNYLSQFYYTKYRKSRNLCSKLICLYQASYYSPLFVLNKFYSILRRNICQQQ